MSLIDDQDITLPPVRRLELLRHIAAASFSDETRPVREWSRVGPYVVGRSHPSNHGEKLTLETMLTSVEWHAVKHTAQGEWPEGTTTDEYVADMRGSAESPFAVLHVGRDRVAYGRGQSRPASRAGICTDIQSSRAHVHNVLSEPGHHLLTLYDPSRRRIVTSYRIEAAQAAKPVDRWTNHRAFR